MLMPFCNVYASGKRQDDTKAKYEELARLCAGIEQELDDTKRDLELHKARLAASKRENESLRKALAETDTQDTATATILANKDAEIENLHKEIKIDEERIADLKTELDKVRAERDALRGVPWLKIVIAVLVGGAVGYGLGNHD